MTHDHCLQQIVLDIMDELKASKIWEEAKAADEDGWEVYDPNEDGSIKEWLKRNKPSKIKRSDGIGWIIVARKLTTCQKSFFSYKYYKVFK